MIITLKMISDEGKEVINVTDRELIGLPDVINFVLEMKDVFTAELGEDAAPSMLVGGQLLAMAFDNPAALSQLAEEGDLKSSS